MRENLPQTQVNQDGEFLFKLLADNSRVLKGIHIMSEDYAQIEWSNNDDFQGTNSATYICRHFHNGLWNNSIVQSFTVSGWPIIMLCDVYTEPRPI